MQQCKNAVFIQFNLKKKNLILIYFKLFTKKGLGFLQKNFPTKYIS